MQCKASCARVNTTILIESHSTLCQTSYRRQIDLGSSNVQRSALVVVANVNIHTGLDVAPHEGHITLKNALAQHIRYLLVRLIQAATAQTLPGLVCN